MIELVTDFLARHSVARDLVTSTALGLGVYIVCALIVLVAESRQKRDAAVYRTRGALNDLAYAIFYQCSIYSLIAMPLFALLVPRMGFLRVGLLLHLPPILALVICWLTFDFLNYWVHRLQHAVGPLWAFHSVHHAPEQLTFLSSNRIHFVEQLYVGVLMLVPAFILGIPQPRWLPILFLQLFSETLQHSRLGWSFGALHRFVVSPAFHAVHHSADPRHHNRNFGRVFSLWDALFGTLVVARQAVTRFGIDGMRVPERITAQFAHPFRMLALRLVLREHEGRVRPAEAE